MAKAFGNTRGKALSSKVETYEYKDNENIVRLIGGILPRYVYWLKGSNGKDIPVECLAFDREEERFNNAVVDPVPEYFPDKKCSWAYTINCIDIKNQKVVALNLKKKLFEQIQNLADDLGLDPTDPDTGFDIVFKKAKTGPLPFNVEYTLSQIKSKPRALTSEEKTIVEAAKPIDEKYPRPTVEDITKTLVKITTTGSEEENADGGGDSGASEAARDL